MPTPVTLARPLQTKTVAERGVDTSAEGLQAVDAWMRWSRSVQWSGSKVDPTVSPTYLEWSWRLNFTADAGGKTRRVWRSPDHWDSPAYWEAAPLQYDDKGRPKPYLVPWGPKFATGLAPAGMDADVGYLCDDDPTGATGHEMLGIRIPTPLEVAALNAARTKPVPKPGVLGFLAALFATPAFLEGDYVCDGYGRRTLGTANVTQGRGGGDIAKRRGMVTKAELDAGIIGHALCVTAMNLEHGAPSTMVNGKLVPPVYPGGAPTFRAPSTRVEHPDRWPNDSPTPAGRAPGKMVPHGQAYALVWTDEQIEAWLDSRGYLGALRRTARIFAVALRDYGWELVETCKANPQAEATLDAAEWKTHGVNDGVTCSRLMDGCWAFAKVVALNPADCFVMAA